MEAITQIVADSLARHGLDRPVDPRRLQWSRWFRCDSTHSLLVVPSKPGIFALAEEVIDLSLGNAHVGTAAPGCPAEQSSAVVCSAPAFEVSTVREGPDFSRAEISAKSEAASAAEVNRFGRNDPPLVGNKRLLAILKFSEDDDMAFTLDRMFTRINPMRERLASGRCFLRFVVIDDQAQRRSICTALNQWMLSSVEKATGLPPDFSSSLELDVARAPSPATAGISADRVGRTLLSDSADGAPKQAPSTPSAPKPDFPAALSHLDSGAAKNLHCPHPLPSGF